MTDLTDRMRTCAAFLATIEISEVLTDERMEAIIDARKLLIEAAGVLEVMPVAIETIAKLTEEPVPIIEPVGADGALPVDHIPPQTGTWVAPGGPLPYAAALDRRNPRACPKCDSRAWKRVSHQGNQVMLHCPVCGAQWEWRAAT
jgi:hypothetical protein